MPRLERGQEPREAAAPASRIGAKPLAPTAVTTTGSAPPQVADNMELVKEMQAALRPLLATSVSEAALRPVTVLGQRWSQEAFVDPSDQYFQARVGAVMTVLE